MSSHSNLRVVASCTSLGPAEIFVFRGPVPSGDIWIHDVSFSHGPKITAEGTEEISSVLRGVKKRIACSLEVYSDSDVADGRVGKRVKRRCISITGLFTEDAFQQSYATLKFSWQLLEPRRHHDPRVCERCRAVLLQGA